MSAHRTPDVMVEYASTAADRGLRVIIAGAGGAAHLPGMTASMTTLPVIGVPVPLDNLDGLDSLLSIVQMPAGIPVATVAVGNARNAGLLAVRILGRRRSRPPRPARALPVRPGRRGRGEGRARPQATGLSRVPGSPHAAEQPDKPAYVMAGSGEVVTYGELDERSNQPRAAVLRPRPALRRPHRDLHGQLAALPRGRVGRPAVGPLLHAGELPLQRRGGRVHPRRLRRQGGRHVRVAR